MQSIHSHSTTREQQLEAQVRELQWQLQEAEEAIEAVRQGQVDALVIHGQSGAELYGLRTADLSYRVFVEGMKEGAVTLSTDGIVLYANQQFCLLAAGPSVPLMGHDFQELVTPAQQPLFHSLLAEAVHSPVKTELTLQRGNGGQPIHVQMAMAPMNVDGQTLVGVLVTDLTASHQAQQLLRQKNEELARINAALEASNHDLQQFASVASHDLQEPLRKIQLFTNKVLEMNSGSLAPEMQKFVLKIGSSATRMKALVVDVLNYSRLSAQEQLTDQVNLNQLMAELTDDFELRIAELNAQVSVGPLPTLPGNPGQLRQVFQNLLSNALKFVPAHRQPVIRLESCPVRLLHFDQAACSDKDAHYALLSFQDNGIGFDPRFSQRVFSLFERLNAKDAYEGSGIGLAIAKKIVEKHGGLIRVQSEPGAGTCFQLLLPTAAAPASATVLNNNGMHG